MGPFVFWQLLSHFWKQNGLGVAAWGTEKHLEDGGVRPGSPLQSVYPNLTSSPFCRAAPLLPAAVFSCLDYHSNILSGRRCQEPLLSLLGEAPPATELSSWLAYMVQPSPQVLSVTFPVYFLLSWERRA